MQLPRSSVALFNFFPEPRGQGRWVRPCLLESTIIESAARPDRLIQVNDKGRAVVVDSADEHARWVNKPLGALLTRLHIVHDSIVCGASLSPS
jgi:hypothetical protein